MVNERIDISRISIASKSARLKAFVIDDVLITILTFIILWQPMSSVNGDIEKMVLVINGAFWQIVVLKFLYQTFFIWYYGATIGKILTKTRVVDENFQRVGLNTSVIRSIVRVVSENIFYLGFIMAYFTPYRQTLHDKLAKTLVIDV